MAGNNIQGQQAVEEIVKVWAKLEKIVTQNVEILERYSKTSSSLPSDYLKQVEETRKAQEALNKALEEAKSKQTQYTNLKKEEARQIQKTAKIKAQLAVANSKETKEYHKLNEAKKLAEKLNREEAKRLVATQGLYAKVQSGINQVTKKYQDLAVRKELNGKLSAEEVVELGKLEAKLNRYQNVLKKVDANIGKHQRNVGNYKSTFDGLGFSVAQISRELPAFANSMQTGFMAISNNIPMLVDEVNRLKDANKALADSGKPTVSVMKSLGKAIFSWQSLISIGITLLTVYGAKIFETIFAISEEEKALKEANKQIQEQNKALKENIELRKRQLGATKNFINNTALLSEFQDILNDMTRDGAKAEAILGELSDRLEGIGVQDAKFLTDSNLLASDRLKIAANLIAIEEQKIKLEEERNKQNQIQLKQEQILQDFKNGEIGQLEKNRRLQMLDNVSLKETVKIRKEIARLNQANQDIIGKTIEIETKASDKSSVAKIKGIEATKESLTSFRIELEKQIETLEKLQKTQIKGSAEYRNLENQIRALKNAIDPLKDIGKEGLGDIAKWSKGFKEAEKRLEALRKETEKFIDTFSDGFLRSSGLGAFEVFFDGTLDRLLEGADTIQERFAVTFNAIAEAGQQAFNLISEASRNNFEEEYERLEQQKAISLQFAGESAVAKERIEEQYEAKRKAIQQRQAKAQKDLALFNIAVNMAQGIVSALASTPPNIPLSVAIGVIGATQLAMTASRKIPQFWAGGETPGGQIMVNDDPLGVKGSNYKEVVVEPSGKVHKPQGRNVKMNVPKGSKVYPTYTDFNKELENMLNLNGVFPFRETVVNNSLPVINMKGGLTANEMDTIIGKHFSNLTTNVLNIDGNGFTKKVIKGASATVIHNNQVEFKGLSV